MNKAALNILNVYIPFVTSPSMKFPQANGTQQCTSDCNAIEFYNYGNAVVYINNRPLNPNETWEVEGNIGEINQTTYVFTWPVAAAEADKALYVTKKTYQQ